MDNKILVVVDYQKDFVNGVLATKGAEAIDEVIVDLIKKRKEQGWAIIYTMDTHSPGSYPLTAEGKLFPPHCMYLTDGWKLYGKTGELLQDGDLNASRLLKDAIGYTEWWDYLLDTDVYKGLSSVECINEVELCGLDFNYCVFQNALILRNLITKASVAVNYAACETFNHEMIPNTVKYLRSVGVDVVGYD